MHSTPLCVYPSFLRHKVMWPKGVLFPLTNNFTSLSCRSSLLKLLRVFWSLSAVGFLLSCHCLLKFLDTLQRNSLVSALLFCPLYIFLPLYSFYESEKRNKLWKPCSYQLDLQYIITKEHLLCLFRANTWDLFPQNASILDTVLSLWVSHANGSDETINSSFIGHYPTVFWEGHRQETKMASMSVHSTHSRTGDNYISADDKVLWRKLLHLIKWTFPFCLGSWACVCSTQ